MGRRLALHLVVLGVVFGALRIAVIPAEVCPVATAGQVRTSVDEAAAWLIRGQEAGGRYTYGYQRDDDRVSPDYNSARHAGVTMSLYQYGGERGHLVAIAAADRGLAYMLANLVHGEGWSAWRLPGEEVPLGANALLLAALVMRRQATGEQAYDALMGEVGRFLLAQQQPDGSMYDYWDPQTGAALPTFGKFSQGEAAWALALLDVELPGEGWAEAALPTLDYLAERRDRAEGYLTRMPDHWAAYAMGELDPSLLDEVRIGYARQLAGYFGVRIRFEAQRRGTGINLAVRWYPGTPAGVGTAGEGIGALWRLGQRDPRLADLLPNIEDRLACFAGMMVSRQPMAEEATAYARPELVQGAWFYRGYVQMDDVQHVMSALLAALPVVEARERSQ